MADIVGVRVAPDLSILDSLIIICNEAGGQTDPIVVFNGQNYIVAWADALSGSRGTVLKAVRVDTHGTVVGSGEPFGSGNTTSDIAWDGSRCLAVWSTEHEGITGRFINEQALPEDSVLFIDTLVGSEGFPRCAYDGTNYLVVWSDFDSLGVDRDIFGRIVSPDGAVVTGRIAIADTAGHQTSPGVSFNGHDYLVAWGEASDVINGRFIAPSGQLTGTIFQICDTDSSAKDCVDIASGLNNHLIVWSEWHTDFDVYGNCDVEIGQAENVASTFQPSYNTTIIAGPLSAYGYDTWQIFDITGRNVCAEVHAPGVYFAQDNNGNIHKVVKIR